MRIEESAVRLESGHEYARKYSLERTTLASFGSVLGSLRDAPAVEESAGVEAGRGVERVRMMLQELVAAVIEALTGEKCRCNVDEIAAGPEATAATGEGRPLRTLEWQTRTVEHIEERERTTVGAEGKVRTADGREIDFTLSLSMCREFSCTRELEESGRVVFRDPLVVNFDGRGADLTEVRFDFDLDADGTAESLPTLARGSGYLALDRNGDGCINDGRELFGTCSGDGFADLAQHDGDGNGWIDEADPVYAALGIWFPDGQLKPLAETGVGALYLGSVASSFALNDADNRALGQVRRSGIYLNEDGSSGVLQQIDLATRAADAGTDAAERTG